MIFKSRRPAAITQTNTANPVSLIADEARALRPLTPSLYYACVQERLATRAAELASIQTAMDQARAEGYAAAVRLMSLDAPERVVHSAFTDLSGEKP